MKKGLRVRMASKDTAEILLYEDIDEFFGVSAKMFAEELKALGRVKEINVRVNSQGGSVFEAHAIYSSLKRNQARITVDVDGIAASAASVVVMAGEEIRVSESAFLMIHDPFIMTFGTAADLREKADTLDKIESTIRDIYVRRTGNTDDDIDAMMAAETWMTATEALDLGFADKLSAPMKVAAHVDPHRFRRPPKNLIRPETNGAVLRERIERMRRAVAKR